MSTRSLICGSLTDNEEWRDMVDDVYFESQMDRWRRDTVKRVAGAKTVKGES